jgi:hypothetical protein
MMLRGSCVAVGAVWRGYQDGEVAADFGVAAAVRGGVACAAEDAVWGSSAGGELWNFHGLVFASRVGRPLDATNVIRSSKLVAEGLGEDCVPQVTRVCPASSGLTSGIPSVLWIHLP